MTKNFGGIKKIATVTNLLILTVNIHAQKSKEGAAIDCPMAWFKLRKIVLDEDIVEERVRHPG